MVQANAVAANILDMFHIPTWATGIVLVFFVGIVLVGGIRRIGKFTEKLVPFMVVLYIVGALIVLAVNVTAIPAAFGLIFKGAFTPLSVIGGVAGYAIMTAVRLGVSRGCYSNEAGLGLAPIAHATAITDHPSRQGMWGTFEVFVDTIIVCTMTALVIITSGVYTTGESPTLLTATAVGSIIPGAKYFIGICILLFSYTTILGLGFYGGVHTYCLIGIRASKVFLWVYLIGAFIGSIGGFTVIWGLFDIAMGLSIIPNMLGLLLLSPLVFRRTREFFNSPGGITPVWEPVYPLEDRSKNT
jgi:AGCS family alanine or glycine:cation symporter